MRLADRVQAYPVLYVCGRTDNKSTASSLLARFNALTGERMEDLPISYDSNAVLSFYPCNSVLVDEANNIIVHNLALQSATGNKVSLVKVDPITGAGTTMTTFTTNYRIDHLAVKGAVDNSGTYYVFAACGKNSSNQRSDKVCCWRINNGQPDYFWEKSVDIGNAGRVQVLDDWLLLVDSDLGYPEFCPWYQDEAEDGMYNYNMYPVCYQPVGATAFKHIDESYLVMATDGPWRTDDDGTVYPATTDRYQWTLFAVNDYSKGSLEGTRRLFDFPQGGIGSFYHPSGDYGAPVVLRQRNDGEQPLTWLYAYSPGNGLAAYSLVKNSATGIDDLVGDADGAADVATEWYTLQGVRVDGRNLTPGIYITRQANKVTKRLVK